MKIFRLSDGTEFRVNDESGRDIITLTCETSDAKILMDKLTPANIKSAMVDDESMKNMVYGGFNASPINGGVVNITLYFREKTEMEIIEQRLDEQDEALMELAELIGG